jgi:4-hydroxy-tetrahydrodipicolinate synthase
MTGRQPLLSGVVPVVLTEAQKILLAEGGIIASDRTRAPLDPVSPRIRRGLLELAAARDLLIMRWAR